MHARPRSGQIAVVGVPLDENSSFMRGPAAAPGRIREALHSGASNLCAESGIDLGADGRWLDVGDLALGDDTPAFERIEAEFDRLLNDDVRTIALGGDHSITLPIIRAHARAHRGLTILQLDAHPDLYDELDGNRASHACPFARIMEERLAVRLVQVGIRTMNPHQREQAERFGVEVVDVRDFESVEALKLEAPLYVSLDLDVLDPAFAPGVSHHEPGGFTTRELLSMIQSLECPVIGADIVEFNPARDPVGVTAMLAAKILKEMIAAMLVDDRARPSR